MENSNTQTHISLVSITAVNKDESEVFFDNLYKHLGLENKYKDDNCISYWGPFGVKITEQKDMLVNLEKKHRCGFTQVTIRVGTKGLIHQIYEDFRSLNYRFAWEPRNTPYCEGHYSICLLDPDDNEIEILHIA